MHKKLKDSQLLPQHVSFRVADQTYSLLNLFQRMGWAQRGRRYHRSAYQEYMKTNLKRVIDGLSLQLESGVIPTRFHHHEYLH